MSVIAVLVVWIFCLLGLLVIKLSWIQRNQVYFSVFIALINRTFSLDPRSQGRLWSIKKFSCVLV